MQSSLKFFLSSSINLISSFLCEKSEKFGIYWSLGTYVMAYLISFLSAIIVNRFSSNKTMKTMKSFKSIFFVMISFLELLLFFIIECSILNKECTLIQKITDLNRMMFLFWRYLMVNKLLLFKFQKTGTIFLVYSCHILVFFFIDEEKKDLKNLVAIILGLFSISIFSVLHQTGKKINYIGILKQLSKSFFLIRNGKGNSILCIKGELLKKSNQIKDKQSQNLKNSYLNNLFLFERSYFNLIPNQLSIDINNEDEFVRCQLDHLINKAVFLEKEDEVRIKIKIKLDLSKSYILSIRKLNIKRKAYIFFNLTESSEPRETKKLKEISKRTEFFFFLEKIKNLLSDSRKLIDNVLLIDNLRDESIYSLKVTLSKFLMNIIKIDNLSVLSEENEGHTNLNLTKMNISLFGREITEAIIPIVKSKNIIFRFSMDDYLKKIKIEFDFQKLRQILLNLLFYSIKVSKQNSEMKFCIGFIKENAPKIKFTIHNTGIKMTPEKLSEINSVLLVLKDQNSEFIIEKNYTALMASQKLLNSFGGLQKGLKITTDIESGSTFEFSIEIGKIYFDKNEDSQQLSFAPCTKKKTIKTYSKKPQKKSSSTLIDNDNNNSVRSLNTSCKIEEPTNEITSQRITHFTSLASFATFSKLNSSRKVKIISNRVHEIPNVELDNIEESNCDCKQILLIDNNFFNTKIIHKILLSLNLKCHVAENEEKAMKILVSQTSCTDPICQGFKIIFINFCITISNCVALIKQIKGLMNENSINTVPILGSVSSISKEHIKECISSGLTDFISNPLNKNAVLNSLMKWTNLILK